MDQPLISVIIPVYNTAAYLDACLQSALDQPLGEAEFLCIDDGSTDESPAILARWAQQDGRVRVIRQENRGLSAARNAGLCAARGEYICFLDSDDLLLPGALREMYAAAAPEKLDLLLFEFDLLYELGGEKPANWWRRQAHGGLMTGEQMFQDLCVAGDYRCMVWGLCARRDFLLEGSHSFVEGMVHEDELFTLRALLAARRVRHLYRPLYVYRLRGGSIVNSPPSLSKLTSRLRILLEEEALGLSPALAEETRRYILDFARFLLDDTERIYGGCLPGAPGA